MNEEKRIELSKFGNARFDSVFGDEDGDKKELKLTKSQVGNLIAFIARNLFREIRTNDTLYNMDYVCDICEIFRNLKNLNKSDSKSEETD